jgi:hypothetical protein
VSECDVTRHGPLVRPPRQGLTLLPFHLNVSAFGGMGGAFRVSLGGIQEVVGGWKVCFVAETAQVKLKTSRL